MQTSLDIAGQQIPIAVSGRISAGRTSGDEAARPLSLALRADLGGLQAHLTPLLQTELNQSNRCGERVSVENATLVPAAPAARLVVALHFEKWVCIRALGRENAKRLVGGNGVVHMLLTPRIADENSVRLDAEVGEIEADGSLGQWLRDGTFGSALRDRIRESLLKAVRKSTALDGVVPARAQGFIALQSVEFGAGTAGSLALNLNARLAVPAEQMAALMEEFSRRR